MASPSSLQSKRKIIIDTDPGQDDALAILLAFASPEIELLGITAVAGNVPLNLTRNNALKLCELASKNDVPVYSGAIRPLVRPLVTAEEVHGKTGLDGPTLPEPKKALEEMHAVDFIIQTIEAHGDNEITLCPIGPLTNIAQALNKAPHIAPKIREIVMMGGGYFEGGNITPVAEFNVFVDPHAAKVVFESGVPIVMMPLDVTHKALTTKARVEKFRTKNTPICDVVVQLLEFYERFDIEKYGDDGAPLHDPNVIAYLIDPSIYTSKEVNVEVETQSELTMGMTVVDYWGVTERPKNALYVTDLDHDRFFDILIERIASL